MIALAQAIYWFGRIVDYALLARAILSWVVRTGYGSGNTLSRIYDYLVKYTEPIVSPVRNLINRFFRTGMIDWSIFATMILVGLVVNIVVRILLMLG